MLIIGLLLKHSFKFSFANADSVAVVHLYVTKLLVINADNVLIFNL